MKKPKNYSVTVDGQGIATLNAAGMTCRFRDIKTLRQFGGELWEALMERRYKFRIDDLDDGSVRLTIHKATLPILFKNYDDAVNFSQLLQNEYLKEELS